MTVSLAILGPPVLRVDGEAVRVPAGRQSRTLLHLAIRRDQVVSQDRLVEMLWPDDRPEDPDNAVQYVVSRLRRLLEPARDRGHPPAVLQRVGEGYRLRLPAEAIDAAVLEQVVASGSQDVTAYRAAVEAWRGRPFLDHPDDRVLQTESARLSQLFTAALGRWAALALEAGDTDVVIEQLGSVVAPGGVGALDESLHRWLMIGLYRHGRQTDALAVFERLQVHLGEELGLDPGPALVETRDAILRHDEDVLGSATVGGSARVPAARMTVPPAAPVDTFVGREAELAALPGAFDQARLVTVTGPSGVGKTRLAEHFGWNLHSSGAADAPVIWVSLDTLTDPDLVLPTVAEAAGLRENLRRPALQVLAEQLGSALLILDNAEHVLDAVADLISSLLGTQPRLRALVTSQARLGVRGEQVLTLDPLEPPAATSQSWASPAVQLFCDRAAALDGTFSVDETTAEHVAAIVTSLDGLPLAIELAAASARTVGVAELAARVDRSLDSLGRGGADRPDRHRTLESALEWSLGTLSPEDRDALQRLSVFAHVDLEAAAAVGVSSLQTLTRLMDRSFLRREEGGRYRMLATMRRHVWVTLDAPQQRELTEALVAWVRVLLDRHGGALRGAGQVPAMDALDAEVENVHIALDHLIRTDESGSVVVEVLTVANRYWDWRGRFAEALHWNGRALAALESRGLPASGPLLGWQAFAASQEGEFERALAIVDIAVDSGWVEGSTNLPGGLVIRAVLRRQIGDLDGAIADATAVLDHARQVDSPWGRAWAHNALAHARAAKADTPRARRHAEASLEGFAACGDQRGVAWALTSLADVARADTDPTLAVQHATEAARLAARLGDARNLAWALEIIAWGRQRSEPTRALTLVAAAARLRGEPQPAAGSADQLLDAAGAAEGSGASPQLSADAVAEALSAGWSAAGTPEQLVALAG